MTEGLKSPDWMEAFEAQATPKMIANAEDYARMRARGAAKLGAAVDDLTPRELVADALADTLEGVVSWDPKAKPLPTHIDDVVAWRTRHLRVRAKNFPRTSIDHATTGALVEIEQALDTMSTSDHEAHDLASQVLAELREMAVGDEDVLRILDAYGEGAGKRAEVLRITKMKSAVYERARKRLNRLVNKLSPELRKLARIHA